MLIEKEEQLLAQRMAYAAKLREKGLAANDQKLLDQAEQFERRFAGRIPEEGPAVRAGEHHECAPEQLRRGPPTSRARPRTPPPRSR